MTLKLTKDEEVWLRRRRKWRKWNKRPRRPRRWKKPSHFYVWVYFDGYPDRELEKRVAAECGKRYSDGSGYDFINGERDLSFGFDSRALAIKCARRIKKIRAIKRVTVEGRVWP